MGDVSTIQRPSGTVAKGDQVGELVSAGWTNETHNMYISSMEVSFMQQLRDQQQHHHHASPDRSMIHVGSGHGLKVLQEGASDNLGSEKNVPRPRDVGARGTDTVQAMAPKHGRGVSTCVRGNPVDRTSVPAEVQNCYAVLAVSVI
uniref:Uncharacterized protein n=1 Tax=Aegilops tauschii TaxID=37682 RepID=M8BH71_AEGTA